MARPCLSLLQRQPPVVPVRASCECCMYLANVCCAVWGRHRSSSNRAEVVQEWKAAGCVAAMDLAVSMTRVLERSMAVCVLHINGIF